MWLDGELVSISIHASRGGSDRSGNSVNINVDIFQSTLPVGEATKPATSGNVHHYISIHASRGGSDKGFASTAIPGANFNPRFPWGKRHHEPQGILPVCHFNPRFPWGKRPVQDSYNTLKQEISIHASRGGSDISSISATRSYGNFNPRFPWGKRQC